MYLEIIKDIETFFTNHNQVNQFEFGNKSDISNLEKNYPMVWLESAPSSLSEYTKSFSFNVFSFTLLEQDMENLRNGLNDTQNILLDFISYFKINQNDSYWLDTTSISLVPFDATFDDFVVGWEITFDFTVSFNYDSCNIPTI